MRRIAIVLGILLLLSACTDGGNNAEIAQQYRTGTQGLTLSFIPGVPPAQVFADSDVSAIIEVKNRGATDVNNAVLYLTGYDKKYLFGSDSQQRTFSIPGKSAVNPNGELIELVEFETTASSLPPEIDTFKQTFHATVCYDYETLHLQVSVLILPFTQLKLQRLSVL